MKKLILNLLKRVLVSESKQNKLIDVENIG